MHKPIKYVEKAVTLAAGGAFAVVPLLEACGSRSSQQAAAPPAATSAPPAATSAAAAPAAAAPTAGPTAATRTGITATEAFAEFQFGLHGLLAHESELTVYASAGAVRPLNTQPMDPRDAD